MKKFILVYYGQPKHASAEEAKKGMEEWKQWAADLGDAVIEPGNPAKPGKMVTKDAVIDTEVNAFTGYTIVQADSLEVATGYAKNNPHVLYGAPVSVHELMQM